MIYAAHIKAAGIPPMPVPAFNADSDTAARAIVADVCREAARLTGVQYVATIWESRDGKARTLAA